VAPRHDAAIAAHEAAETQKADSQWRPIMMQSSITHSRPMHAATRSVDDAIRTWWRAYQDRRRIKATIRTLSRLEDRILKDIGLDRSEIESVVTTGGRDRRLTPIDRSSLCSRH